MEVTPNFDLGDLFALPADELKLPDSLAKNEESEDEVDMVPPTLNIYDDTNEPIPNAQPICSTTKAKFETERFATSEQITIDNLVKEGENKNTLQANNWAYNVFRDWIRSINSKAERPEDCFPDPENLSDSQVEELVPKFVVSARKTDGQEYARKSILALIIRLQMYYRTTLNRCFDFVSAKCKNNVRKILDAKMKQLSRDGHGVIPKQAQCFTESQIQRMWDNGIFGDTSPRVLLNTVFFFNGVLFGLRGGQEHRELTLNQFSISEKDDFVTLSYSPKVSKTFHGGISQKNLDLKTRVHTSVKGSERCIVQMYKRYFDALGETIGPFYRRPADKCRPGEIVFQKGRVLGKHTISNLMKSICAEAGLVGNYTNHSSRRTCVALLAKGGLSDDQIKARSGHRSDAINVYKEMSDEQQLETSNILHPPAAKKPFLGDNQPCSSSSLQATQPQYNIHAIQPGGVNAFGTTVVGHGCLGGFAGMFAGAPANLFANATFNIFGDAGSKEQN